EGGVEQQPRQLAAAVGTEVEEERRVARLDPRAPLDVDGLDELVRYSFVVLVLDVPVWGLSPDRSAIDDGVEGALGALPAPVAVHRVVAAGDGGDAFLRQRRQVVHRRMR